MNSVKCETRRWKRIAMTTANQRVSEQERDRKRERERDQRRKRWKPHGTEWREGKRISRLILHQSCRYFCPFALACTSISVLIFVHYDGNSRSSPTAHTHTRTVLIDGGHRTGRRDNDAAISIDALNFVISQVKKVNAILDYQDQTISIRRVALRESLACYNHIETRYGRLVVHWATLEKWCEAQEREWERGAHEAMMRLIETKT